MARRRKSQARRGGDRRVPIWIWLLGGMLIGLGLSAALLIHERGGRLAGPRPNPSAQAPREPEAPLAPAPKAEPERQKPRYDFYTLLRERETRVSDQELAEKVRAETAQKAAEPAPRERYLLQAGAFRDLRDADAVKARIALAGLLMPSLGQGRDEFYLALLLVMNGLLLYRLHWSWRRWNQPVTRGESWYQDMVRYCVRDMLILMMALLWLGIIYR